MPLLNEGIQKQVRQVFDELATPVKLVMFSTTEDDASSLECEMCTDTRNLIEEVAALSNKISFEVFDFSKDEAEVRQFHVDKIPALVMLGGVDERDYGIRFYGIPSGYEFSSLIEGILTAGKGEHGLSQKTVETIAQLDRPVHIQVYVTPT